jgi:protoporphyrin/coproporphyrin ferrochelatase
MHVCSGTTVQQQLSVKRFNKKGKMATQAIVLANLGSPDSTSVRDVRTYLNEFLMDERVIDIPYFLRALLVRGIIVPFRAPKSAAKYKTIWTDKGSPLLYISRQVQNKVADAMQMPVELCMRYANPTPAFALNKLLEENPDLKEVVLVPLYPHYAMSSYETAVEHVKSTYKNGNYPFDLKVVPPFYDHPEYIDSLANSIKPFLDKDFDHLLFSYHGVPMRHILKTDCTKSHCFSSENCCSVPSEAHSVCYRHQVTVTTNLVAERLGLPRDKFSFSFQSRLGTDAWLQPYTAEQLKKFPREGIKKLIVVCPAFVSDCLETLEEIREEGREDFMHAGGEEYSVIPCLNAREDWIQTVVTLVNSQLKEPATA